jgi:signal transduction histidine kinase
MYRPGTLHGLRASGEEFPIEATISQVESAGQKLFTVILRDISERKRAEDALRTSEKLAATGRLAATIAHEINNPLEAVTNLMFLAKNDPGLPPPVRDHLDLADQELGRVSHIARQTLGFYRDSSSPVPIKLSEVMDGILQLYTRRIAYKNLQVERRYQTQAEVFGLIGEVRQVFSNLLVNAMDASSKNGRIIVHVAPWRDPKRPARRGVRVTVADQGSGIPAALRSRVFEPFFSTKRDVGTGLGLWVSRALVEKHEGQIRFRSSTTPGRTGTVFSVFLPADPASPEPAD